MGLTDVLWVFVMISALQPILRQKILEASRLRLLHRIEQKRQSRVIALVHRQETMSLLGFPLMRYIDVNDSEAVTFSHSDYTMVMKRKASGPRVNPFADYWQKGADGTWRIAYEVNADGPAPAPAGAARH